MNRPVPPDMPDIEGCFVPDQDGLGEWARRCFINPGTPLHNPDHAHLARASIGWLWTNGVAMNRGRRIAGEARMPRPAGAKWTQQLAEAHLNDLFGGVPNFVITIDAELARDADDASFCALIEHELYHCGQDIDPWGAPRETRFGEPIFTMRGHDIEQFIGVVRRYGAEASGVAPLIRAAQEGPGVQDGAIALACGTCGKLAA